LINVIDDFDVGSIQELNGVDKLELWTDGKGIGNGYVFFVFIIRIFPSIFFIDGIQNMFK
jgi:hypothetical protein